eukprot:2538178-Amphidinium_carterae.2
MFGLVSERAKHCKSAQSPHHLCTMVATKPAVAQDVGNVSVHPQPEWRVCVHTHTHTHARTPQPVKFAKLLSTSGQPRGLCALL